MAILNALLQPEETPVTSERGTIGYQWDTTTDRGMIRSVQIQNASIGSAQIGTAAIGSANIGTAQITSANIHDFSFNQGSGGTLTLGGTLNGQGVFYVKKPNGSVGIISDATEFAIYDANQEKCVEITYNANYPVMINALDLGGTTDVLNSGQLLFHNATNEFARLTYGEGLNLGTNIAITLTNGNPPASPSSNQCRLFVDTDGGKLRLMAQFGTNAATAIATEP